MEIRGNIIPATIFDKKDGIIKEDINTKAIITNKGAEEAEEIEEETTGITEGDIFELRK